MNLDRFNKDQREAILSNSKNTLVIAGAGSGKTSVLVGRITKLIEDGARPESIFAVTFTNKAAAEMKERVLKSINCDGQNMSLGTFHSLFGKILKDNFKLTNLSTDYQILDTDDQKQLIKSIINESELLNGYDKKELRTILPKAINQSLKYIGTQKDLARRHINSVWTLQDSQENIINCKDVYKEYEFIMNNLNLIDFGDLLLYPYEIFRDNENILSLYQDKFSNVLVDEFQDTNFIQYDLVKSLSKNSTLFIVGDDDQSIYGWRGAEIENILRFEGDMNAKVVKLEQNYRSTKTVLSAANNVISNNTERMGKNLWSDNPDGSKILLRDFERDYEEADFIANEIKNLIKNGTSPNEIAILYRNNSCSRALEKSLNRKQIKYVIIGGVSFWKRSEVKDIISMLSLIENENNIFAFKRAFDRLTVGVGEKSIEKINGYKNISRKTIIDTIADFIKNAEDKSSKDKLTPKQTEELVSFYNIFTRAKCIFKDFSDLSSVINYFASTNFVESYADKDTEEAYSERCDNLKSLIDFAENITEDDNINSLSDFVNYAMLQSAADEKSKDGSVQMMTLHSSKGLEFECVFLSALNSNLMPSPAALKEGRIEEERRLFYVGITRAKKKLYLSNFKNMYNEITNPSIFIDEVPEDLIERGVSGTKSRHYYQSENNKVDFLGKLYKGARVNHPNYGYGIVERFEINGNLVVIYANFGEIGIKGFSVDKKDIV